MVLAGRLYVTVATLRYWRSGIAAAIALDIFPPVLQLAQHAPDTIGLLVGQINRLKRIVSQIQEHRRPRRLIKKQRSTGRIGNATAKLRGVLRELATPAPVVAPARAGALKGAAE